MGVKYGVVCYDIWIYKYVYTFTGVNELSWVEAEAEFIQVTSRAKAEFIQVAQCDPLIDMGVIIILELFELLSLILFLKLVIVVNMSIIR